MKTKQTKGDEAVKQTKCECNATTIGTKCETACKTNEKASSDKCVCADDAWAYETGKCTKDCTAHTGYAAGDTAKTCKCATNYFQKDGKCVNCPSSDNVKLNDTKNACVCKDTKHSWSSETACSACDPAHSKNICKCNAGYSGDDCSVTGSNGFVMALISLFVGFFLHL